MYERYGESTLPQYVAEISASLAAPGAIVLGITCASSREAYDNLQELAVLTFALSRRQATELRNLLDAAIEGKVISRSLPGRH